MATRTRKTASQTEVKETAKAIKKLRRVPLDTIIPVVNNRTNELVYVSARMAGMRVEWEQFGDVRYVELGELNAMRGAKPRFFEQNWIVVEPAESDDEQGDYTPEEIYMTLGVSRYYEHVVTPKTLDALYKKPLSYIKQEMGHFSDGTRKLVYERAKQLLETGEFDSISKFNAIKELAGVADIIGDE